MEVNNQTTKVSKIMKLKSERITIIQQQGFTMIEVIIAAIVLSIVIALALPSYFQHITTTKRGEMMVEMQKIANNISEQKLIHKKYKNIPDSNIITKTVFPNSQEHLYTLKIENLDTGKWILTATPQPKTRVADDGILTLNYKGIKCRGSVCSTGDDWRK